MTTRQSIGFAVVAAASAAVFVVLHLALPIERSWTVNRILHYAWEGAVILAGVGGVVWIFWRRPKASRRDLERQRGRRRVIGMGGLVVMVAALVAFAEVRRERTTRAWLRDSATEDLREIARALDACAAAGGAVPPSISDLAPKYLDPGRLYYVYRGGPPGSDPPPAGAETPEPPSYALGRRIPSADSRRRAAEVRLRAFLRSGHAWAPMTVVLTSDGRVQIVGDDEIRGLEKELDTGRP